MFKFLKIFTLFLFLSLPSYSEEQNKFESEHQWNFYSGMFDFSDDGAKSTLFGIQHHNENLIRDSFLGTLSPVTGLMLTADNATYFYTVVQLSLIHI